MRDAHYSTFKEKKRTFFTDYLQNFSFQPVQSEGNELIYQSLKTKEGTPSFCHSNTRHILLLFRVASVEIF